MSAKSTFKSTLMKTVLMPMAVMVAACSNGTSGPTHLLDRDAPLPPIRTILECLPQDAALVAAHRATSSRLHEPENSISALERLIGHGTLMAEVDIAAIRDGTPIIFHDGVWDDHASGTGPVVATSPEDFARLRLKDGRGRILAEPVPTLAAFLDAAKDRIYLEIDLKTSADLETVIALIRDRGMVDQTLLIASSDEEAEAMLAHADEFLLSLPRAPQRTANAPKQGVWIGERWQDGGERQVQNRHYVIGAQWQKNPAQLARAAQALDILVTRQALRYAPVAALDRKAAFRSCVAQADE